MTGSASDESRCFSILLNRRSIVSKRFRGLESVHWPRLKQQVRQAIKHAASQRRPDVISTSGGRVAFDGYTDLAAYTVRTRGPRFLKADEATPKFDDGLQHHRAAALYALHGSLSLCPTPEPTLDVRSNK